MTQPIQKSCERHFVEEAAKCLGKSWSLGPDREIPDFLVTEDDHQFGLEVCDIFIGEQNERGSVDKKREANTQRAINAVRLKYEKLVNIPLTVKFVGDLCAENMAKVVPALVERKLVSEPVGHQTVIDIDTGLHAGLRVYVTKGFRPVWINVGDRVGWVDRNPMPRIVETVCNKSQRLRDYKKEAGSDIRLLIVANRIQNSGKLMLEGQVPLDKKGFHAVYFFSYPENVVSF